MRGGESYGDQGVEPQGSSFTRELQGFKRCTWDENTHPYLSFVRQRALASLAPKSTQIRFLMARNGNWQPSTKVKFEKSSWEKKHQKKPYEMV